MSRVIEHDPDTAIEDANTRDDIVFVKEHVEKAIATFAVDDAPSVEYALLLNAWALSAGMKYIADMMFDIREILSEPDKVGGASDNVRSLGSRRVTDTGGDDAV